MKVELELDIESGDLLVFNEKEWRVDSVERGTFDLEPVTGSTRNFTRSEIQELLEYSGKMSHVKSEYIGL